MRYLKRLDKDSLESAHVQNGVVASGRLESDRFGHRMVSISMSQ